jgi:serine/threonine-protein kinase
VIGERIGAYRILQQIGEGGMGTVWLAEHTMLGRRAAIKMLHANVSNQPDLTARFFNEARAAAAIEDPGIVQIFDFGQHTDGRAYIVMELLDGESLDRRLGRLGRLPVRDALRVMRQIASSLGAAHQRGIVHRDLKPDNVFLVRDPEVSGGERAKILDFGIAKITGGTGKKTATAVVMGTPLFMSPEQCRGAGKVDQRSDVYSMGCVLFVLLTGRTPFYAEGPGEVIAMHLREMPPIPSTLAAGIPHIVDSMVLRCLEKDPARRYASGREVASALEALAVATSSGRAGSKYDVARTATQPPSKPADSSTTLTAYAQAASQVQLDKLPSKPLGTWRFAGVAAALLIGATVGIFALHGASVDNAGEPISESAEQLPSEKKITGAIAAALPPTPTLSAPVRYVSAPNHPEPQGPPPTPVVRPTPSMGKAALPSAPTKPGMVAIQTKPSPGAQAAVRSTRTLLSSVGSSGKGAIDTPAPSIASSPSAMAEPRAPKPEARAPLQQEAEEPKPEPELSNSKLVNCAEQVNKLEEFVKRSYSQNAASTLQQGKEFSLRCLNHTQRVRLAMLVIPAACSLDDRMSVVRFFNIVDHPPLRAKCEKILADREEDEAVEGEIN